MPVLALLVSLFGVEEFIRENQHHITIRNAAHSMMLMHCYGPLLVTLTQGTRSQSQVLVTTQLFETDQAEDQWYRS